MALQLRLPQLCFKQTQTMASLHSSVTQRSVQWIHSSRASASSCLCNKNSSSTVFMGTRHGLGSVNLDKTHILASNKPYTILAVFFKSGIHDDKQEKLFPNNEEMNLRHSVENDYLSWMRNTYMMTLAGLTVLNTSSLTDNMVISKVVFLTACMNLSFGTLGYLHSLGSLRRREVMKNMSAFSCQVLAIVHWLLWISVILLIIGADKDEDGEDVNDKSGLQ